MFLYIATLPTLLLASESIPIFYAYHLLHAGTSDPAYNAENLSGFFGVCPDSFMY